MSIQASEGDAVLAPTDRERIRQVRRTVVQRLSDLEKERADLAGDGHPEEARGVLRAFQEVALVLEAIDEILKQ